MLEYILLGWKWPAFSIKGPSHSKSEAPRFTPSLALTACEQTGSGALGPGEALWPMLRLLSRWTPISHEVMYPGLVMSDTV